MSREHDNEKFIEEARRYALNNLVVLDKMLLDENTTAEQQLALMMAIQIYACSQDIDRKEIRKLANGTNASKSE